MCEDKFECSYKIRGAYSPSATSYKTNENANANGSREKQNGRVRTGDGGRYMQ